MAGKPAKKASTVSKKPAAAKGTKRTTTPTGTATKAVAKKSVAAKAPKKKTVPAVNATKSISKKSVTARGPIGSGPGGGTFNPTRFVGWQSGELQAQIGTKNKDKKKLVMDIWYEYFHDTATTYQWSVQYRLKAEDKKLAGSGWNAVNQLASLTYNFKYKQGSAAAVTKAATLSLNGQADTSGVLFGGAAGITNLPVFSIKTATGTRFGGPSGIQIVW